MSGDGTALNRVLQSRRLHASLSVRSLYEYDVMHVLGVLYDIF